MNQMKSKIAVVLMAGLGLMLPHALKAQDQNINGNLTVSGTTGSVGSLTVTGTADIWGNSLFLGTHTGTPNTSGFSLAFVDGTATAINFAATASANNWQWFQNAAGTAALQMSLSGTNTLTLYDQSSTPLAKVTLNPLGASTFSNSLVVNGTNNQMPNQTLTGASSVLTQGLGDGRYVSKGQSSLALFPGASASGPNSMALGYSTTASGSYSTAIGYYSWAVGDSSFAEGAGTYASGYRSVAMGDDSSAGGEWAVAFGAQCNSSGNNSFTEGFGNLASGSGAIAIGEGCSATYNFAFAEGDTALAAYPNAIAMGLHPTATGVSAIALGEYPTATGWHSFSAGYYTSSIGGNSVAMGDTTTANGQDSAAFGCGTVSQASYSMAIGRYNLATGSTGPWVSTDPLFEVGNGTDATHLSDALIIYKSGNATFQGNVTTSGTATFLTTSASAAASDIPMFGH